MRCLVKPRARPRSRNFSRRLETRLRPRGPDLGAASETSRRRATNWVSVACSYTSLTSALHSEGGRQAGAREGGSRRRLPDDPSPEGDRDRAHHRDPDRGRLGGELAGGVRERARRARGRLGPAALPGGPLLWDAFGAGAVAARRRRGRASSPSGIDCCGERSCSTWPSWARCSARGRPRGSSRCRRAATGCSRAARGVGPCRAARVLAAADGLEWLYLAVHEDTYAKGDDPTGDPTPGPAPTPTRAAVRHDAPTGTPTPTPTPAPTGRTTPSTPTAPAPPAPQPRVWPFAADLHPLVRSIPASAEVDVDTLGKYIRDHEPDRLLRIKALHDWVADRISYDVPALSMSPRPSQDPSTVFRDRKGVCAGYAQLLEALGRAAGTRSSTSSGDVRSSGAGRSTPGATPGTPRRSTAVAPHRPDMGLRRPRGRRLPRSATAPCTS